MKFSTFIKDSLDAIVANWETFARTLPSTQGMTTLALRDHSREILLAVAADMDVVWTDEERAKHCNALSSLPESAGTAAAEHGGLRYLAGFDLVQLFAEFRALRASVMELWHRAGGGGLDAAAVDDVIRFNEGMDKALAESVRRYSSDVAASRDMFLAVLGHDLRGPLSSIDLSAMLLTRDGLSGSMLQQATTRIKRASREMNRLITDLLEYTRTRLGAGIPIAHTFCDIGPVCEEAVEAIRAGYPEQQFNCEISGDLHTQADCARLQQALANLLNNAVQHGDRQTPVVLSARSDAQAIVLKVSNQGEPIPADALQTIFEPLVQVSTASAQTQERSKTSLGLGLFIVREIVLGHGGSIDVESTVLDGTAFTIRLPRPATPPPG